MEGQLLTGKVALVTGSSRGIGASIAKRLAQAGAMVAVNFLSTRDRADAVVSSILEAGGRAVSIQADVRDAAEIHALVQEVVATGGGLDILVNNAHTPFRFAPFSEVSWHEVQEQVNGTLKSAWCCTKAGLPFLRESSSPAVLNISSITTKIPEAGITHRTIIKGALESLTLCLATELAQYGIRVNTLSAGWTSTGQLNLVPPEVLETKVAEIPLGRFASQEEVANAALMLVCPWSSYISGSTLICAGGQ